MTRAVEEGSEAEQESVQGYGTEERRVQNKGWVMQLKPNRVTFSPVRVSSPTIPLVFETFLQLL